MLRVGLIGCGGIGAVHARCWLMLHEEVRLVAIADSNRERANQFIQNTMTEIRIYSNYSEMLEKEILDIADICVPTFLHAEAAVKAMRWVKNIIVEKPVCLMVTEAEQMLKAEKEYGSFVQVAHVVRFTESYSFLKKVVKDGTYGKIVAGYFSRISPRPMWMAGHDDVNRTGTMALDMHIHDADFIRYLMEEEPDDVDSWVIKDENEVIQHIWSSYRYGKVRLVAEASWDYPIHMPFSQTFRVKLENAAIVLGRDGDLTVYPNDGNPFVPVLEEKKEVDLGINISDIAPYFKEIQYFVHRIQSGKKNGIITLADAVKSLELVNEEMRKGEKGYENNKR
ncbi:MAG: Gfo/Idh/MocA family oxidoreductase [Roseburia sp.]|nr:Gfo/Idh/MocA family oxidoreductase [Roseburia sp.]